MNFKFKVFNKMRKPTKRQCFTLQQYQRFKDEADRCKKDNAPVTCYSPVIAYKKGSELINKEHFCINDEIVEGCEYRVI